EPPAPVVALRPAPTPPLPPPPVVIPDGEPREVALKILKDADRLAAAEVHQRAMAIAQELDRLLEIARLDTSVTLGKFIQRAAYWVRLRNTLQERLPTLEGGAAPSNPPVDVEVASWVRQVRRWRDGDELRVERARIAQDAIRELGEVEAQVAIVADRVRK